MTTQRKSVAGPMALTSVPASRKSYAASGTLFRYSIAPNKEIVTVHTGAPAAERRAIAAEHSPVYQGRVNLLSSIEGKKDILCCKYTEDMDEIAVGFTDGVCRLYDCAEGNCTHTLEDDEIKQYPGPITCIKHRPINKAYPSTNQLLTSYVNGCIKCWNYKYDQCIYTIREKRQTFGLSYHPRFTKFVSYGDDAKIHLYDEEAQTQERSFYSSEMSNLMDGHTSRVFAALFNPKSNHELISGGWDNAVMCWDDRQPHATKHFFGVHMCGEGLDFNKAGREILTCSWSENDAIQVWDYGSCKLIETIVPDTHKSKLYCGRFVPDSNFMICGGSDANIIRVINMRMGMTDCSIRNNPGGIYGFDFGKVRRKAKFKMESDMSPLALQEIPRVAFVAGKKLQQVDFG